jgi:DnaK suppressor protein
LTQVENELCAGAVSATRGHGWVLTRRSGMSSVAWVVETQVDSVAVQRVAERRDSLTAMVVSLTERLDGIKEASAWTAHDDEHDPEGVTIAFERAQVTGLLDMVRDELRELDSADARIRAGTYGECQRCGKAIGSERLEALPATTTCIGCADRRR